MPPAPLRVATVTQVSFLLCLSQDWSGSVFTLVEDLCEPVVNWSIVPSHEPCSASSLLLFIQNVKQFF